MARVREILFGGAGGASPGADAGLLLLRAFAGVALAMAHGLGKLPPKPGFVAGVEEMGFPAPMLFAWLAGLSEFGGGLLIAIGLLTRPAAFFVLMTMLTAAFVRHAGDPFTDTEKALLFGSIALFLLLAGAGRYSVDALVRGRGKAR